MIGADGIKSVVRKQLFSDKDPVFAGEHAYRTVIPLDATQGMVTDDNLRMYVGHGTKVYLLPLRHRDQMSFDITALNPDGAWTPTVTKDDILATVEGFDERIVEMTRGLDMGEVNVRAVYDIDPVDTWHSDCVVLVGDAAHAMLHHQGQGANSAIMDVGALADALRDADSVSEALARYHADRKPVTDELQRISRQGWTEDEINDVFPGQKPATMGAGGLNADATASGDRKGSRHPARATEGRLDPVAMRAADEAMASPGRSGCRCQSWRTLSCPRRPVACPSGSTRRPRRRPTG